MRARIRRGDVLIEFVGRGQTWNELLRPLLGGPEAPHESETAVPAPTAAAAAVSLTPHRPVQAPAASAQAPAPPRPAAPPQGGSYAAQPAPSAPRTWYPPKPDRPQRFEPQRQTPGATVRPAPRNERNERNEADERDEDDAPRVEPSNDPATLYARLAALPGRRSERDAVLAAVWFLTKAVRETNPDEVEHHFHTLGVFPDVKVVPALLKHVHRTKMLEAGTSSQHAVRLTKKGAAYLLERLVRI